MLLVLTILIFAAGSVLADSEPVGGAPADDALVEASTVGLSDKRLRRLRDYLSTQVDQGAMSGVVVAVARRGQVVMLDAFGRRSAHDDQPMAVNAVFDLAGLTRPVSAAVAMMLQEQGQWLLSDLVTDYLPALGRHGKAVTVLDLLRQTSGLTHSVRAGTGQASLNGVAASPARLAHSLQVASAMTGTQFLSALADSSYRVARAGTHAAPGFSYDVLGLALEQVSGQTLGALYLRQLFIPLDMWDTGFSLSGDNAQRFVPGAAQPDLPVNPVRDPAKPLGFECASVCLTSTASDYLRFVQMLLDDGRIADKRLMSRISVRYMVSDRLSSQMTHSFVAPDEVPDPRDVACPRLAAAWVSRFERLAPQPCPARQANFPAIR